MTREEAIKVLKWFRNGIGNTADEIQAIDMAIKSLSADAESDDLIIKGAKGIQDGLYNIKDGKLFKYKAKGGSVRTYTIEPSEMSVNVEYDVKYLPDKDGVHQAKATITKAVPNCKKCAIKELWEATEKEDLVAVVRCKDCKNNYNTCTNHGINQPMCDFTDRMLKETDFCSRGERREE
jgi:hypothetical protein